MKPEQYINQFSLNTEKRFNREDFINEIKKDYLTLLDPLINIKDKSNLKINNFNTVTRTIREKWDAIFKGSLLKKEQSEKFWGFFYATVVIDMRTKMFPDFKKGEKRNETH